jgi:predicted phage replisome organizer
MANDVKWIKITTDIFDDEKILLIESMPDSYAIIVVWFKLLCLAGKQNNSGVFMISNRIPYTDKMLATIFRMKESTVQMALQVFEQFGMVELVDGVITIPNWNKHQSLDAYEAKKERDRLYQAERRAKQRALVSKSSDTSADSKAIKSSDIAPLEEERDKERDKDKEKKESKKIDYQQIADMYNSLCPSFPSLKSLSESRKKAIKARLNTYSVSDFEELFKKAEASDFLKGNNGRNWTATFDWLIKDGNMAKVLEGNYDNRQKKTYGPNGVEVETPAEDDFAGIF